MTSSREIGSSTTRAALRTADWNASDAAILKLISEESTGWNLPSMQVTATSTTGKPHRAAPGHRFADTFFDRRDELAGDGPADDLVVELKPSPRANGSTLRCTTAYWPCPPVCFL